LQIYNRNSNLQESRLFKVFHNTIILSQIKTTAPIRDRYLQIKSPQQYRYTNPVPWAGHDPNFWAVFKVGSLLPNVPFRIAFVAWGSAPFTTRSFNCSISNRTLLSGLFTNPTVSQPLQMKYPFSSKGYSWISQIYPYLIAVECRWNCLCTSH
jgi:hypothetical protein